MATAAAALAAGATPGVWAGGTSDGASALRAAAAPRDAALSLASALARLRSETALLSAVIVRNESQHRRAPHWRAFRRLHKRAARLAQGLSREHELLGGGGAGGGDD